MNNSNSYYHPSTATTSTRLSNGMTDPNKTTYANVKNLTSHFEQHSSGTVPQTSHDEFLHVSYILSLSCI